VKKGNPERFIQSFLSRQREREIPFILKFQGYRNKFWDWYFFTASVLGEEVFFITFVPFCCWNVSHQVALHLTFLLAITVGGGNMIKNYLQSPRPPPKVVWVNKSTPEHDPGFPSTHTMTAFSIPWYLIIFHWETTSTNVMLLSLLVLVWWSFSIAISRIYNGHHYIVDVLGGFFLSIVTLSVWTQYLRYTIDPIVTDASILVPIMIFGCAVGLLYMHPQAATPNPACAETALVFGTCAGTAFGVWLQHYSQLTPGLGVKLTDATTFFSGGLALMTARFVTGVVVVALVREASKRVFLPLVLYCYGRTQLKKTVYDKTNYKHTEVDVMLKLLTYAAVSFSVTWVVPHLCCMLGLFHASDLGVFVKYK